jgi:hypothetical protein
MAAFVQRVTTRNTTAGAHAVTVTPAVDDLLIAFVEWTDGSAGAAGNVTVTDDQGGTWTFINRALKVGSTDTMEIWVRDQLATAAVAHVVTQSNPDGSDTGGGITVSRWSGMTKTGAAAVRQVAKQDNQAAGTPAPVFPAACLTGNPTAGVIHNLTNPATMTPPTGWTEQADLGYNTPVTGFELVTRDSGFTGTTVTWGSASASTFSSLMIELDASAGIEKTLGPVTTADSAQPLLFVKPIHKTAGVVSQMNAAQPLTWGPVRKLLGVVTQSSVAVALSVVKPIFKTVGIVSGTNASQPVTFTKTIFKALGAVSTVDAAVALSYEIDSGPITLGIVTQPNAALALTFTKTIFKALGIVLSGNTAVPLTIRIRKTLGIVTEADSAVALVVTKPLRKVLGIVSGANAAQPVTFTKTIFKTLGVVLSSNVAVALRAAKARAAGAVTQLSSARPLTFTKVIFKALSPASTQDIAQPLQVSGPIRKTLGIVAQPSAAQPLSYIKPIFKLLGLVSGATTARSVSFTKPLRRDILPAITVDTAQRLPLVQRFSIQPVGQNTLALPLTFTGPAVTQWPQSTQSRWPHGVVTVWPQSTSEEW